MRIKIDVLLLILLLVFAVHHASAAQVPTLKNLDKTQAEKVVKDFSANFVHTSVSPASGANGFGIELGAITGVTQSPGINEIAKEDYGYLPHAGALGILYLPWGFGGEAVYVPTLKYQGLSFQNQSFAFRWTPTEIFSPNGFLQLRVRGYTGNASIKYSQYIETVPVNIKYGSSHTGGDLALSFKNIPFVEPYATVGYLSLGGKLKGEATATLSTPIFNPSYTQAEEVTIKQSGIVYSAGIVAKFLFFVAGAEYANILGDNRVTLKLALGITQANAKSIK